MKKQKLVIIGAGGFGREVFQLISEINNFHENFEISGFIDQKGANSSLLKSPLLGDDDWALANLGRDREESPGYVLGIGSSVLREKIGKKYSDTIWKPVELIHPRAILGNEIRRGSGCIICAGTILTTDIQLGNFVNLNLQCTIGHDAVLGDFVSLHPGVRLSGNVRVGRGTEIGTGAVVLPGVKIGDYCTIGAGAVVNKDCEAGKTYVGVPAREINKHG